MKKIRAVVLLTAVAIASIAAGLLEFVGPRVALADAGSRYVVCTATISPGAILTSTVFTSSAIACPQVHMGDFVLVSALTTDPGALAINGKVTSAGNIKITFTNASGGTITPASDTYSVAVLPRYISP